TVETEHLAAHRFCLVSIVQILVVAHGSLVQKQSEFAVWKLGGKIVGCFFQRSRIGVGRYGLVGVEFRLSLGLRGTLTLGSWCRLRWRSLPSRCSLSTLSRLTLRRGIILLPTLARGLRACAEDDTKYRYERCDSLHGFSEEQGFKHHDPGKER